VLRQHLYQHQFVPAGTAPYKVLAILTWFTTKLQNELKKTYQWYAVCTVAVEGGRWGGERRRKRRLKLLHIVNVCRKYLDMPEVEQPNGWERVGLYYGYGCGGVSPDIVLARGLSQMYSKSLGLPTPQFCEPPLQCTRFAVADKHLIQLGYEEDSLPDNITAKILMYEGENVLLEIPIRRSDTTDWEALHRHLWGQAASIAHKIYLMTKTQDYGIRI